MTKILIFIVFFFFGIFVIHSQNKDTIGTGQITITTTITDYLPSILLTAANINLGADIPLTKQKSIAFNIGFIKSYGPNVPGSFFSYPVENTTGIKLQAEGRYYLNRYKLVEPLIPIFWPHIFQYHSQQLENTGYYLALQSSYEYTQSDQTIIRSIAAIGGKIGYQCIKKSGFVIDFAVGFGVEHILNDLNMEWNDNHIFCCGCNAHNTYCYQIIFQLKLGGIFNLFQ